MLGLGIFNFSIPKLTIAQSLAIYQFTYQCIIIIIITSVVTVIQSSNNIYILSIIRVVNGYETVLIYLNHKPV